MTLSAMPGLWGEVGVGVYDGLPKPPEWHRTSYRLGPATGQSDRAPPPGV